MKLSDFGVDIWTSSKDFYNFIVLANIANNLFFEKFSISKHKSNIFNFFSDCNILLIVLKFALSI